MSLYSLNKDMLIKLIVNIKENTIKECSDEDLKNELRIRKDERRFKNLKKALLSLKNIPHLKEIESFEKFILEAKNLSDILPYQKNKNFIELLKKLSFYGDHPSLKYKGSLFDNIISKDIWTTCDDEIIYNKCKSCTNYEILYNDDVFVFLYNIDHGFGIKSTHVNNKCMKCRGEVKLYLLVR